MSKRVSETVSIFVGNGSVSFYDGRWGRHYRLTAASKRRLLSLPGLVVLRPHVEWKQSGRYRWGRRR